MRLGIGRYSTEHIIRCATCNTECTTKEGKYCKKCAHSKSAAAKYTNPAPYTATPEIDRKIIEVYKEPRQKGSVVKLAKQIGWTRTAIRNRALKLNLRVKAIDPPWTEAEIALVRKHINSCEAIIAGHLKKAGYYRTRNSIAHRIQVIRLPLRDSTYTAQSMAVLFGVNHNTVYRWINLGFVEHKKLGDTYSITTRQIRKFIQHYPLMFDIAKVDQISFLDVITDGKIGANNSVYPSAVDSKFNSQQEEEREEKEDE